MKYRICFVAFPFVVATLSVFDSCDIFAQIPQGFFTGIGTSIGKNDMNLNTMKQNKAYTVHNLPGVLKMLHTIFPLYINT